MNNLIILENVLLPQINPKRCCPQLKRKSRKGKMGQGVLQICISPVATVLGTGAMDAAVAVSISPAPSSRLAPLGGTWRTPLPRCRPLPLPLAPCSSPSLPFSSPPWPRPCRARRRRSGTSRANQSRPGTSPRPPPPPRAWNRAGIAWGRRNRPRLATMAAAPPTAIPSSPAVPITDERRHASRVS